jgi:hypothetical protein
MVDFAPKYNGKVYTGKLRTPNQGFPAMLADGRKMTIFNSILHLFGWTNIAELLHLTSTLYFQSAAFKGWRFSNTATSPSRPLGATEDP